MEKDFLMLKREMADLQSELSVVKFGRVNLEDLPKHLRDVAVFMKEMEEEADADHIARHFKLSRVSMCTRLNKLELLGFLKHRYVGQNKLFRVIV